MATPDSKGIIRFPPYDRVSGSPYFGIPHQGSTKGSLLGIEQTVIKPAVDRVFSQNMDFLWSLNPLIDEVLCNPEDHTPDQPPDQTLRQGQEGDLLPGERLRLVQVTKPLASGDWLSMPDILRSLPPSRIRVFYLKVFQVLMGQHSEKTDAISVDQLKKHLLKNPNKGS